MKLLRWVGLWLALTGRVQACIWDADTMFQEKWRHHDLASVILGEPPAPEDPQILQARIKDLEANRNETKAEWWNNLAGAYLRLSRPEMAVKLLEPVVGSFTNDYGMHANLGTAYHLLGRYAEAEKEIARDLEINPEAHFGLEKYHLALLQYLVRDADYKKQHVYVDEFSRALQKNSMRYFRRPAGRLEPTNTNALDLPRIKELTKLFIGDQPDDEKTNSWAWKEVQDLKSQGYVPPDYRFKWDLAKDTNFIAGVIYMAQMNPKEPVCFEMLGVVAYESHDYNLAVAAFEKAVALGSSKSETLKEKITELRHFIEESMKEKFGIYGLLFAGLLVVLYYIYTKFRARRRRLASLA